MAHHDSKSIRLLRARNSGLLLLSAAGLCAPPVVSAQELAEVTVTAQRREQSLQDVSAAVTAIGSDRLESARIDDIEDLQLIVPSVTFGNDFNMAKLFIRGVGANTSTTGSETGVALHVDGAVVARAEAQRTSLFDLERVEVLRGPQGTLYGRNAVGGSINLITAKPTATPEGYVRLTIGNHEALGGEAALSGPITDTVLGRIAVKTEERGGFGVNPVTGSEIDDLNRRMARGHLHFLFNEDVDLLLSAEWFTQDDASSALKFRRESYPDVARLTALGIGGYAVDERDLASEFDPHNETETYSLTSTLRWQLNDNFALTNITNYRDFWSYIVQDLDVSAVTNSIATTGTNTTVQRRDVNSHQASTELQLNFTSDRVDSVLGVFYFKENQRPVDTVGLGPILGQDLTLDTLANPPTFPPIGPTGLQIDGVFVPSAPTDLGFVHDLCNTFRFIEGGIEGAGAPAPKRVCIKSDLDTEAWAIFGQSTFAFGANEQFALKIGGRYSSEDRSSANPSVILARGGLGPVIITTTEGTYTERSFSDFTPEAGLEWRATGDHLLYYNYSEGFKAGAGENAAGSTIIVDPEEMENHEIGLKSNWLDGRLAVNVAVFTYELRGQQINKTIAGGPAGFGTIFENAAETSANGAELEFFGNVTDRFRLSGSVSYLDSEYDDFLTSDPLDPRNVATPGAPPFDPVTNPTGFGPVEIQLAGNPTRNSPELAGNLHAEFDVPVPAIHDGSLTFGADVSYKDEIFFTEFNRLLEGSDSYTMLDASIRFTSGNGNFTAELWGKNLSDELVEASTFALATARTIGVTYLAPRTYGVTFGYAF